MKLSIIILNYNVRYFLELCLKSVQEAISAMDAEIIVVDNNSKDTSCQMVKALFPNVLLIENKENFGFSKGNNIGVSYAKGDYICILNPDTVVAEDTFIKLLKFYESKGKMGVVGCRLINGMGEFLPESKRNIPFIKAALKKLFGNGKDYYAGCVKENEAGKVDILVGAFMLIKHELFLNIGGFDEDYFMYGEDLDLSYKFLKAGYHNYYYGQATTIHFKGESTLRDRFYEQHFFGAMQIFYKKHFKKNILLDILIRLGIGFFHLVRQTPIGIPKKINGYVFISNKINRELERTLLKEVILKSELNTIEKGTEVIFDANALSYKKIIELMESHLGDNSITYKILPKQSNYIIGSDNGTRRGEIIKLA